MIKERNKCLDFIKGMACIGVVFMHCMFPYPFGQIISFIFKFSVPIFFMVSGYYSYNNNPREVSRKLKPKIQHILYLLLTAEGLYFISLLISLAITNKPISLSGLISKQLIFSAFFLNRPMFNGTLWFLYALLFSYMILYIVNAFNGYSIAYRVVFFVLFGHILVRTILKKMNVEWYDAAYFRNALFYGFPLLLWGNLIRKNEKYYCKFSSKVCIICSLFGIGLTFFEYLLSRQVLDFYIGTLVSSFFLFVFSLKNKENSIIPFVGKVGYRLSLGIYIIHILCIDICNNTIAYFNLENKLIIQWVKPLICVAMAISVVSLYEFLKNQINTYISLKISSKIV